MASCERKSLNKICAASSSNVKTCIRIAYQLLDIFSTFGAPSVLQSDDGRKFVNSVITELSAMLDGLKIVHGKPRHSQSQRSVERANRYIEDVIMTWLQSNSTSHWGDGLRFIQVMKNKTYHEGIKFSSYEAMFGQPMKVGLKHQIFLMMQLMILSPKNS